MEQEIEQTREQQKAAWNKLSPGWKKWNELFMDFLRPNGAEIIRSLKLKPRDTVLDVAAGTGEPGLTIAANLRGGKVIITDLAEEMLEVAMQNAIKRGVTNIETRVCDVSGLPFADNSFDAVSCRFGFMFFPDMFLAAKEIARVLKPGGRIATSVWNIPERNSWLTAILETMSGYIDLPAPASGAPGMFRCSKAGLIPGLLAQAGLKVISVKEVIGKLKCKNADVYWDMMTDVAVPVVAALRKADEATKEKIKTAVQQTVNDKYPDGNIIIESSALVITAEK